MVALLGCLGLLAGLPVAQAQTNDCALALVIVYDASGSMKEKVPAANGKQTAKYLVANNAVVAIADKLQSYCDEKKTNVQAGLVVFSNNSAHEQIWQQRFDAETFKKWARAFHSPGGGTPLGEGIKQANVLLARSPCVHKHILIVSDGESNVGESPESVIKSMRESQNLTSIYFVAFDVAARVFDPVKAQGATVVSAADEVQLRTQLDAIVGKKILLEAE